MPPCRLRLVVRMRLPPGHRWPLLRAYPSYRGTKLIIIVFDNFRLPDSVSSTSCN